MVKQYLLEYIWIGGNGELRSKIKIEKNNVNCKINDNMADNLNNDKFPEWNFDGSSTGQANGEDSEVILKPQRCYKNPFFKETYETIAYIVLCDTYLHSGEKTQTNTRYEANKLFNEKLEQEPWYGLEQEYFIIDSKTKLPYGYNANNMQGQYYCSVGTENAYRREIAETHMQYCLYAGISISGINAEVAPGQWEFQVGPCIGIIAGDDLWTARYILHKLGEKYNVIINFEPKPLDGEWNGSGCHANYSTKNMREGTKERKGIDYINDAIERLSKKHKEHMQVYGKDNDKRMTGKFETASYDIFSDGIANRCASIRRGNDTFKNEKGYFEDRRPSSNCDPYLVTSKLFETTVL
jgi:glutamine synthetase